MNHNDLDIIEPIIERYYHSFAKKTYNEENNECDFLMNLFNISPELKRQNRQYWGRELGMLWQLIVVELAYAHCPDFHSALRFGNDEPCDLVIGTDAIDTKYRIGSGDSGTLKKFKQYGHFLREQGYRPVIVMVRDDSLPAAITACLNGGWTIYSGQNAIRYLEVKTGINVYTLISQFGTKYHLP